MSNMLVSIIHTKWVVNCCTLSHKFYRSSSICWNVTYGQKSKAIKIKRQCNRVSYNLLWNTDIKAHKWIGNKRNVRRSMWLVAFFISTNLKVNKTQTMVSRNIMEFSPYCSYQVCIHINNIPISWKDWQNPFTHDLFSLCHLLLIPPIHFPSTNSLKLCLHSPAWN